jgi:hypothetical protein
MSDLTTFRPQAKQQPRFLAGDDLELSLLIRELRELKDANSHSQHVIFFNTYTDGPEVSIRSAQHGFSKRKFTEYNAFTINALIAFVINSFNHPVNGPLSRVEPVSELSQ